MLNDTSLVIDATRKASRFLQRDYFELEQLQSSNRGLNKFCQKSVQKIVQILHDSLSKYYKTIIFDNKSVQGADFVGKAVFVEILDGLDNFKKSLPFFAIIVTILVKKDDKIIAEKAVINFPSLGEIYYSEKGRGSWLERYSSNMSIQRSVRVRVSDVDNIEDALLSTSYKYIDLASKISKNLRLFGSYSYALSLLICGKIDALIIQPRSISCNAVELFVQEAGGICSIQNELLLASNFKLYEKIKKLI